MVAHEIDPKLGPGQKRQRINASIEDLTNHTTAKQDFRQISLKHSVGTRNANAVKSAVFDVKNGAKSNVSLIVSNSEKATSELT